MREKIFKLDSNQQGTADFWKSYQMIVDEKGEPTNYVQCQYCHQIDPYDTNKGTKQLKRHAGDCNSKSANSSIKKFLHRDIVLTKEEKSALNKAELEYCYKDLRPFSATKGEGFRSMLMAISKLSSKYGQFSEEQLDKHLLCPESVSR